jgi:hypothetical protein
LFLDGLREEDPSGFNNAGSAPDGTSTRFACSVPGTIQPATKNGGPDHSGPPFNIIQRTAYQIFTRCSGGGYILSPDWTLKAA